VDAIARVLREAVSRGPPMQVFNRGFGPMFPVRVLVGVLREFLKLSTQDSLFVDSPLSALGVRQVRANPRARWVTLRARWVTLRARWVMLRARR
jgi:hypothetical protein